MVKKKIEKVQNRRYIASGTVLGPTTSFCVPKGCSNIYLVYEITTCGLNEVLWDPKLYILYVEKV